MSRSRREVEWADVWLPLMCGADTNNQGIRGIASLFIVTSHLVRAYIPNYLSPADDYNETPHLFQRPFLRLIAAGPFWTSIFFLLSGYVCAFKPIRLANAGQADEARRVIASSAFRRVFRIGVPATILTFIAWTLCQMGIFRLVGPYEFWADWLPNTTPRYVPGFIPAIRALLRQCVLPRKYDGNSSSIPGPRQRICTKATCGL
jgi:Acyltransferase family